MNFQRSRALRTDALLASGPNARLAMAAGFVLTCSGGACPHHWSGRSESSGPAGRLKFANGPSRARVCVCMCVCVSASVRGVRAMIVISFRLIGDSPDSLGRLARTPHAYCGGTRAALWTARERNEIAIVTEGRPCVDF